MSKVATGDRPKRPDYVEWRFTEHGMSVHALWPPIGVRAVCGLEVIASQQWRGTGAQVEYDIAAALPICRRCAAKLRIEVPSA